MWAFCTFHAHTQHSVAHKHTMLVSRLVTCTFSAILIIMSLFIYLLVIICTLIACIHNYNFSYLPNCITHIKGASDCSWCLFLVLSSYNIYVLSYHRMHGMQNLQVNYAPKVCMYSTELNINNCSCTNGSKTHISLQYVSKTFIDCLFL